MKFSWLNFYRRIFIKKIANLMPTPPQHCLHDKSHWWERKIACLRLVGMQIDHHVAIDSGFFYAYLV